MGNIGSTAQEDIRKAENPTARDATIDSILRAHCKAEAARAEVWLKANDNAKVLSFFTASKVFWTDLAEYKYMHLDAVAIRKCKEKWDEDEKNRFTDSGENILRFPSFLEKATTDAQ